MAQARPLRPSLRFALALAGPCTSHALVFAPLLLSLPLFAVAVPVAVRHRSPCRRSPSLSLLSLTFLARSLPPFASHGLYRHSLLLSLSSFAIAVPVTVRRRCPCCRSLSMSPCPSSLLSLSPFAVTVPVVVSHCCPFHRFAVAVSVAVR